MRLNKNILIIILLLTNLAMTWTLFQAQKDGHRKRHDTRKDNYAEIGWDEHHQVLADSLRTVYGDSIKMRFQEIRNARMTMLMHIDGSAAGDSLALDWANKIGQMHTELNQSSINLIKKLDDFTPPEKKALLIELMTSRAGKHKK